MVGLLSTIFTSKPQYLLSFTQIKDCTIFSNDFSEAIKRQNNAISGRIDNKQNICKVVIPLWPKVGSRVGRFVEGQPRPIRGLEALVFDQ